VLTWLSVWGQVRFAYGHCHSLCLAPVNPDWFYLPGFTFLVPAHLGSPGQNPEDLQNDCSCCSVVYHVTLALMSLTFSVMTPISDAETFDFKCGNFWSPVYIVSVCISKA